jgi:Uma2 family endonuclease
MASGIETAATIDDLYQAEGKAELVAGKLVYLMPTGRRPNRVAFRICQSLDAYARQSGRGECYTDNIGFVVPELSSGRQSFSPDASYFFGPFSQSDMRFLEGPPAFAVEVRSENDYGDAAESEMASKRADYFEAGTPVVWDVDTIAECVHIYHAAHPEQPTTRRRGETADAEPALPGWSIPVDDLFA